MKIKELIVAQSKMYKVLRFIYLNLAYLKSFILFGKMEPAAYVVDDEKKVIYMPLSRIANIDIQASICHIQTSLDDKGTDFIQSTVKRKIFLKKAQKQYYKFAFVRNPYSRLVSCYEAEYHEKTGRGREPKYDFYLFGYFRKDKGFEDFVKKVVKIPDCLAETHFISQSAQLCDRKNHCKADYIGHFETLQRDYKVIQEKYGFQELRGHNSYGKRRDWEDYYTEELAKLVYDRFKWDFENFGYEDEYVRLLGKIRDRENVGARQGVERAI